MYQEPVQESYDIIGLVVRLARICHPHIERWDVCGKVLPSDLHSWVVVFLSF